MLTRGMGKPTYELLLSLVASWWGLFLQRILYRRFFTVYSGLYCGDSLVKCIILCASCGHRALKGSHKFTPFETVMS